MLQSERARETPSISRCTIPIADAPTVSEFRVGQVTRSGLGSFSLQDRQGLSGHSLRLCLSSWYGDVSLAIDIRDGNNSLWQQPGTLRCTSPFSGLGRVRKPSYARCTVLPSVMAMATLPPCFCISPMAACMVLPDLQTSSNRTIFFPEILSSSMRSLEV